VRGSGSDRSVVGASSVDVTSGERPLVGPPLGPADTGAGGVRRGTRRVRTRDGGRRTTGVGGTAGGGNGGGRRNRGRVRRVTISKTDSLGSSNDESIERVGPDVGPLESVVHPGEAGEFIG
jgi:hypothetical protein